MADKHWGLRLISGPDNIRGLPKAADSGIWTAGDILTLDATGKVDPAVAATTDADVEDALLGVGLTTEAADANAETNYVFVDVSVFTTEQVWSIKVEDGKRAYNDYEIGVAYELGYYGTATSYDVGYISGETARTVTADEFYYLSVTEATDLSGAVVVATPGRGAGVDVQYGGRVHIRFTPHACMQITG